MRSKAAYILQETMQIICFVSPCEFLAFALRSIRGPRVGLAWSVWLPTETLPVAQKA